MPSPSCIQALGLSPHWILVQLYRSRTMRLGVTTAKGGAVGAVSGATIYGLTNYASLSAPFAGAVVSASKGVGSLVSDFNNGEINQEEFIELGMVICSESAIVGFATAAGQAAISPPVPLRNVIIGFQLSILWGASSERQ